MPPFEFFEGGDFIALGADSLLWKPIRELELGSRAQDNGAFDHVFQLPDISRPAICCQGIHDLFWYGLDVPAHLFSILDGKVFDQERYIFFPFPERWDAHGKDVESVKKILAEAVLLHGPF